MVSKILSPYLKRVLNFSQKLPSLHYYWKEEDQQVSRVTTLSCKYFVNVSVFIHVAYLIAQLVALSLSHSSPLEKLQFGGLITLPVLAVLLIRLEWESSPTCVQLLNAILNHGRGKDKNETLSPIWLKTIFRLIDFTLLTCPIVFSLMVLINPCQLPFIGSLILSPKFCTASIIAESDNWDFIIINFLVRIILASFEYLIFFQITTAAVFQGMMIPLSGIIFLLEKTNRLTTHKGKLPLIKYRQLQIFTAVLNLCIKTRIFPVVAYFAPAAQILSGFVLIVGHASLKMLPYSFMSLEFVEAVMLNLIVFTGSGKIYVKTSRCLGRLNSEERCTKIGKKTCKSFTPLKLWFGNNFVDACTTLVIQQFCTCSTMNCLLLF
ncbi:hypothetical protein Fcan01_20492 [Folsomia candida]|uniref:Uncharacterized protein n=1 Tax=Folsomia candida TaxID=158441 RepID=A0A226DJU5_FOLCA|nr:hypothetical protein Fcan01_20492 [Folsomia candida]